jgi:lysyl-tRNA synthetase class 2
MASKAIRAFDYDEARNELTVTFTRGPTYVYSLVPAGVAAAFAASPSPGAFHNAELRDRYPFRKAKGVLAVSSGALREMLAASVADGGAEATPASARNASQSDGSRGRG